jgi:hypothetical protein
MLGDTLEAGGSLCNRPHEAVPHKGIASGGHLLRECSPPGALPYTFPSFLYFHFFLVIICYLVIMFVKITLMTYWGSNLKKRGKKGKTNGSC